MAAFVLNKGVLCFKMGQDHGDKKILPILLYILVIQRLMFTILYSVNFLLIGVGPINGEYLAWENDLNLISNIIQYEYVIIAGWCSIENCPIISSTAKPLISAKLMVCLASWTTNAHRMRSPSSQVLQWEVMFASYSRILFSTLPSLQMLLRLRRKSACKSRDRYVPVLCYLSIQCIP